MGDEVGVYITLLGPSNRLIIGYKLFLLYEEVKMSNIRLTLSCCHMKKFISLSGWDKMSIYQPFSIPSKWVTTKGCGLTMEVSLEFTSFIVSNCSLRCQVL